MIKISTVNTVEAPLFSPEEFDESAAFYEAKRLAELAAEQSAHEAMIASLPDLRIAKVNQQMNYVQSAIHRANIVKLSLQAALKAAEEYKLNNPDAADLVCKTRSVVTHITNRERIDLDSFYKKVLDCIMWRSDELATQKAILSDVNKDFMQAPQGSSIWTNTLPSWQLKKLVTFIDCNRPQWRVNLAGCSSLAQCRQAMLRAKNALSKLKSVKVKVVITDSEVHMNSCVFAISQGVVRGRKYQRIRVGKGAKRQWLRVDLLSDFLGISV